MSLSDILVQGDKLDMSLVRQLCPEELKDTLEKLVKA